VSQRVNVEIRRLSASEASTFLGDLAEVLVDCVEGGASVSFMPPFGKPAAEEFFRKVIRSVEADGRILLAAFLEGKLAGTVQVVMAVPPNQPHRADIAKLLVLRSARGRGLGAALMRQAEASAKEAGKTLLVLDTCEGGPAEKLYKSLGWVKAGVIPKYALNPDGSWCDTVIFWKDLGPTLGS
jgi:ribosomal protein S18 acetylase RimI-like enzyme